MIGMRSKKSGFTLIELVIVLSIIALLVVVILPRTGAKATARAMSAAQSINSLYAAAEGWLAQGNLVFTGISISVLQTANLLPDTFSGTGSNPWGGNFSIAANTDAAKVDIALTAVNAQGGSDLTALFANSADDTDYTGTTFTVTF